MFARTLLFASLLLAAALAAPARSPAPERDRTTWTDGAVFYGVVPSLFGDPPFRAVTDRLDELEAMGIDALWVAPVNETTDDGDFGYEVTGHVTVRDDYGSEEDLRLLVREAHRRGMRVLLDIVPNHMADAHPAWQDVLARGPASPWHGWFDREIPTYFDWERLKNLDVSNPEVQAAIESWFLHWIREYDVDGFRVDVAWGIRERNPELWPRLIRRLRAEKPDLFLLAEASAHDPYYVHAGFDAAYDWTAELGRWAWAEAWSDPETAGNRLAEALVAGATPPHRVARFLNNNDTAERFVTRHGPELTRAAATMLLTLPGLPIVYTGDEVGAEYLPYQDPPPLDWIDRADLRAHYARLVELREVLPSLGGEDWTVLPTDDPSVLAYVRHEAHGRNPVLVVLNYGGAARVGMDAGSAPPLGEHLVDVLACDPFPIEQTDARLRLALAARTAVVLAPRDAAGPVCPSGRARAMTHPHER